MSNILGENFHSSITKQIKIRQEKVGARERTGETFSYLYGNTAWCRLMSGVLIKKLDKNLHPSLTSLNLREDELAKKFILFSGVKGQGEDLRAGLNTSNDLLGGNNSYGIGNTDNLYGIKPMPGITSAQVKTLTNGTLKTSTIQIKAFTKVQFDIIDILYLRLGYTVMLEFGHSNYYNENGDFVDGVIPIDSLEPEFFGIQGPVIQDDYYSLLDKIEKKRYASGGNYEAILGKVDNFSWSYQKDGTYDITLSLRSIGDVIESLKMNVLNSSPASPNASKTPNNEAEFIINYANKYEIGKFFSEVITPSIQVTPPPPPPFTNKEIKEMAQRMKINKITKSSSGGTLGKDGIIRQTGPKE